MQFERGSRIGSFEIVAPLGAGGMGEVYRACDTRLGRDVALKVLPATVASDPDRIARFRREAQLLAALNHPNIAAIYGLEEAGGLVALALELVEGPTLADRLVRGPLPAVEAVAIARQLADGLDAAHDRGIVHRDLKPANIKLRDDGAVKVLDFGLAKAIEGASDLPAANVTQSPTLTSPALVTGSGILLGTAAYMAPEQARGAAVDRRADIWALGCVLFEMLTARPTFPGESVAEVVAAVLKEEPDWTLLPADTPPALHRLLRRSLRKDRARRLQSAADARLELDDAASEPAVAAAAAPARRGRMAGLAWALAALAFTAAGFVFVSRPGSDNDTAAPSTLRADIATPPTSTPAAFALSPDGTQIVYSGRGESGRTLLFVRHLQTGTVRELPGTEAPSGPFWSPDGKSIGYFSNSVLSRVDLEGGRIRRLAPAPIAGGAWLPDGTILFTNERSGRLARITANGDAAPLDLGSADSPANPLGQGAPLLLPDGHHFICVVNRIDAGAGLYVGSIDSPGLTRLGDAESGAAYHPAGWLLFLRQGSLVAQRFDVASLALSGEPEVVIPDVAPPDFNQLPVSIAATGLVAYRAGVNAASQFQWFDRAGTPGALLGSPNADQQTTVELSPDGTRALTWRSLRERGRINYDIFVVDAIRENRLTIDPGMDRWGIWSRDGRSVFFDSDRSGVRNIYRKAADGSSPEQAVVESNEPKTANDVSPDGRTLLFREGSDLAVMPLDGSGPPRKLFETPFDERTARFSPDGRWIAYQSNESGRVEVYVRGFPESSSRWQVSVQGGFAPRWSHDGRELYYVDLAGMLMAVPAAVGSSGFAPGAPKALFAPGMAGASEFSRQQYDVASDGRFLVRVEAASAQRPITLLVNWRPGAR